MGPMISSSRKPRLAMSLLTPPSSAMASPNISNSLESSFGTARSKNSVVGHESMPTRQLPS